MIVAARLLELGPTGLFYLFVVAALLVSSLALLRRPFASLAVTTVYLATANTALLGETTSAMVAAVLIASCVSATIAASDSPRFFESSDEVLAAVLGGV